MNENVIMCQAQFSSLENLKTKFTKAVQIKPRWLSFRDIKTKSSRVLIELNGPLTMFMQIIDD